jgi:spermidine synthase
LKKLLFITGFFSLLAQLVILRELNAAYYGAELIYSISIGLWLLGTALGALSWKKNFIPSERHILLLLILCSLILPSLVIYIRGIREIYGQVAGAYLTFPAQIFSLLTALLPVSFLSGMAFQWSAKLFISAGENFAKAYAIESAGGIAGGIAATSLSAAGLSNLQSAFICSSLVIFAFITKPLSGRRKLLFFIQAAITALSIFFVFKADRIDIITASWNNPEIIKTFDTPYSRISVSYNQGQYSVFEDDALCYESETSAAEEFCRLSLLFNNSPKNVLLLGGGIKGMVNELLKLKNLDIDYVEYNKKMMEGLNEYLPLKINIANNNQIRIIFSDPRDFLRQTKKYDVILLALPEPASGQTNRYYTKEFFELCRNNLKRFGTLSFSLRSEENLWAPPLRKRNSSVYKSLCAVFNNVKALPASSVIFAASDSLLYFGAAALSERYKATGIESRIISEPYIKYLFNNDRYKKINEIMNAETAGLNTDDKPACYVYSLNIWLSKFFPEAVNFRFPEPGSAGIIAALIISFFAYFLFSMTKVVRKYILLFTISMQGMALECALILKYQTTDGILFQNIGLLLTAFMAGLWGGAYFINRLIQSGGKNNNLIKTAVSLFAIFSLLTAILISYNCVSGILVISLILAADGFGTAAIFGALSPNCKEEQLKSVSLLYAADIMGGFAGAILSGLFFIPVLGLSLTIFIGAAFVLFSLLLAA